MISYPCPTCEDEVAIDIHNIDGGGAFSECDCGALLQLDEDGDADSEGAPCDASSWRVVTPMDALRGLSGEVRRANSKRHKFWVEVMNAARDTGTMKPSEALFPWFARLAEEAKRVKA